MQLGIIIDLPPGLWNNMHKENNYLGRTHYANIKRRGCFVLKVFCFVLFLSFRGMGCVFVFWLVSLFVSVLRVSKQGPSSNFAQNQKGLIPVMKSSLSNVCIIDIGQIFDHPRSDTT